MLESITFGILAYLGRTWTLSVQFLKFDDRSVSRESKMPADQIFERLSIMPASLAVDITAMRLKSLECNQLLIEVKSRKVTAIIDIDEAHAREN